MKIPIDTSYLLKRLEALEITTERNTHIIQSKDGEDRIPFFDASEEGDIQINYFNLNGGRYFWKKPNTKWPRPFFRTRLKYPKEDQKYHQEKGSGHFPFFTPGILSKYRLAKDGKEGGQIDTLFVVEGEFKAFKGDVAGLCILGIPSIHGFYDGQTKGKLHEDIQELIDICSVRKIVLLVDADVMTVNWAEDKDLAKRASSFYSAIKNFRESLDLQIAPNGNLERVYFMHIQLEYDAKGLDDLLAKYSSVRQEIVDDANKLHLAEKYFRGFILNDINIDLKKVHKYLGLNTPSEFFETYKDSIQGRDFVYRGKKYRFDEAKGGIEEIRSECPYIRVGTKYFKKVYQPQSSGEELLNLKEWTGSCIVLDHGRNYLQQIPRFDDFCYVPDHIHYQQTVNGFYNRYHAITHLPAPGNCEKSLAFIKHIFGEHYDQGLDYIQLLYTRPRQILPVLCLISEERNTGKTTFLNWLTAIFGRNTTINRNEDFESQFNSDWAGKLIIAVDETFIDRKKIYERIKSLSTGRSMKVEAKGQDRIDAEFFGKVILCSNNEDGFIPVDQSEIRFWVRKVNRFRQEDPHLLSNSLIPEIPYFLQLLLDRELVTPMKTRMWFSQEDIQTEALTRIVNKNKSYLEKALLHVIKEDLEEYDVESIQMTLSDIKERLFRENIKDPAFKIKELIERWGRENPGWNGWHPRNTSYVRWYVDEAGNKTSKSVRSGKIYTFTREFMKMEKKLLGGSNLESIEIPVGMVGTDQLPF